MREKTVRTLSIALFAGLALWGAYTFFVYLGVPVHESALLTDAQTVSAQQACSFLFCRGLAAFFPLISYTVVRTGPFAWYLLFSLVAYGLFLGWRFLAQGSFSFRWTFRPWHLFVLFIASLWLFFTTLSWGAIDGLPFRQIVEPSAQAYVGISDVTLQALKTNFDGLQSRGCLTLLGYTSNGVGVHSIATRCIQTAFFTRVLTQVAVASIFLFELLIAGSTILSFLRLRKTSILGEAMLSLGLGAGAWIAVLWTVAVLGVYTQMAGWALAVVVPVLCYRAVLRWIKIFLSSQWHVDVPWYSIAVVLGWYLLSYLAMNFLTVVRPFPIGWDDLGSYLNRPRLLVSYGHFIPSMLQFQWEYLTSLGFLLFGYDSIFGATASMIINWTEGLIAVLAVYLIARTYLGRTRGFLAAMLFYSLPLIGHFSFADMKVDNSAFALGAIATFAMLQYLFPFEADTALLPQDRVALDPSPPPERPSFKQEGWKWVLLAGLLSSFAFSLKPTEIMAVMALLAIFLGVTLHWSAFVGMIFLTFAVFMKQNAVNLPAVVSRMFGSGVHASSTLVAVLFIVIGLACIAFAARTHHRALWKEAGLAVAIFIGMFIAGVLPWIFYNNAILLGNPFGFSMSAPNAIAPVITYKKASEVADLGTNIRTLPPDLAVNEDDPSCKPSGASEELDRYWGFSTGLGHYLTLPWRTALNLDSAGYYVTTAPYLLLLPLLLLVPFFWTRKGRWLRYLFGGTAFILLEWMFTANGIPWYGVCFFLGAAVCAEALLVASPDRLNRITAGILISLSLILSFGMRVWQFEQQRNILEYTLGKIDADALRSRTIPWYDIIRQDVVQRHETMPDRPYLYRVGTFIPYFIPKNLEIIGITDNQLDFFHCIYQEKNPALTLKRLKALGFNSIIFDTNTPTIERDPNGSLHQKVQEFVDFLNTPSLNFNIAVNDPQAGVAFVEIP